MNRLLPSLALCALLSGCATVPTDPGTVEGIGISASIYPLAHFASQVSGTAVFAIAGVAEPHEFEPSSQDLRQVETFPVFLYNGAGVDPWAERIAPDVVARGGFTLEASSLLTLRKSADDAARDDPHVWLDPVQAQQIVIGIRDTLMRADPSRAERYRVNAMTYLEELRALDTEFAAGLKSCELREIITAHDAFEYLAERYAFTVHAVSGLSPEEDPSPKRLGELADLAKEKGITVIFFETWVSPALSETLAAEVGATTLVLNPLESLSISEQQHQNKTYVSVMRENLAALRTAMRCR